MQEKSYKVPEAFKAELELLAAMGGPCLIKFKNESGTEVSMRTFIKQLYEEDGLDYVLVQDGLRLPVMQLVEVNGIKPNDFC